MKKYIIFLVIAGIIATVAMLLFFEMTVPQMLLNTGCVAILVTYLILRIVKSKKPILPEKEVK